MAYFSIVVLVLVSVVFVNIPAGLLSRLFGAPVNVWVAIIFIYYFVATVTPIDKFIGRIYPVLTVPMLFTVVALPVMLFTQGYTVLPNLDFTTNTHTSLPIWPMLTITIACGAISGFHATQSPLMACCIANEKQGRKVFYGSMILEGVIALIWCTIGLSFYENAEGLRRALGSANNAGLVVTEVCNTLLGSGLGGIIALLGVVLLPITSGDTALRSAMLTVAGEFDLPQHKLKSRLIISIPMLIIGGILSQVNFGTIWRYFGWANQTLATIMLWAAAVYLARQAKFHWVCTIPAAFMTAATVTYLCFERIGFGFSYVVSNSIGFGVTFACLVLFFVKRNASSAVSFEE
jgi:carbon starvation protein CstA